MWRGYPATESAANFSRLMSGRRFYFRLLMRVQKKERIMAQSQTAFVPSTEPGSLPQEERIDTIDRPVG